MKPTRFVSVFNEIEMLRVRLDLSPLRHDHAAGGWDCDAAAVRRFPESHHRWVRLPLDSQNLFQRRDIFEQGFPESRAGADQEDEVEQRCDVTEQGLWEIKKKRHQFFSTSHQVTTGPHVRNSTSHS